MNQREREKEMNEKIMRQEIRHYQTPFYLFDTDVLKERMEQIRSALGHRAEICYAMKANPFLTGVLKDEADSFEVCSPGEFRICERAGIPMEKIVMSGVYKNPEDISYAVMTYGDRGVYTAESPAQWELLKLCSEKYDVRLRVLLRLSSGSQFGMDEDTILRIAAGRDSAPNLIIEGLQLFSGTQKRSPKKYRRELSRLEEFRTKLENDLGLPVDRLEYGPGLPVGYFEEEEDNGDELMSLLAQELERLEFGGKIVLEMGRFIAASCGSYVTGIADLKVSEGQGYCIADGGIHHVNYFGQMMAMKKPPIRHLKCQKENGQTAGESLWTICGSLCTMNDVLVKQFPLDHPSVGDSLVFEKTGA